MTLENRRVAVYVSGSVAAYKSCDVITDLRKRGAAVRVAMTPGAQRFMSSLTLQSLSGHPVVSDLWAAPSGGHGMEHLTLSAWAELQVAVAASASLLARLAHGLADDAVTATALASTAPLLVAPAMETAMWEHLATRENIRLLAERGVLVVGPTVGRLASGHDGLGRLAEPAEIVEAAMACLSAAG
ncbi:MAG: flavoprotein [Candidatus Dormibacteria bacterium]